MNKIVSFLETSNYPVTRKEETKLNQFILMGQTCNPLTVESFNLIKNLYETKIFYERKLKNLCMHKFEEYYLIKKIRVNISNLSNNQYLINNFYSCTSTV